METFFDENILFDADIPSDVTWDDIRDAQRRAEEKRQQVMEGIGTSMHGPIQQIVKREIEYIDGRKWHVYLLKCGHTVKLRAAFDGGAKIRARLRCSRCSISA